MRDTYTVGWYDAQIDDWYFNGEYQDYEAAVACARKTATAKRARARVTAQIARSVEYFEPS